MPPPTVAILGASPDRQKYGNQAVRAYHLHGYMVYPIHPKETMIEGLIAYRSIREIPTVRIDRVSIYLPPAIGIQVLEELVGLDIGEVYLNPGADAPEVVARAQELQLPIITGCSLMAVGVVPESPAS